MADELTDFERRTLENGWIERDFAGIRLAVAQIVAARVAAARAEERERMLEAAADYDRHNQGVIARGIRAALARPAETEDVAACVGARCHGCDDCDPDDPRKPPAATVADRLRADLGSPVMDAARERDYPPAPTEVLAEFDRRFPSFSDDLAAAIAEPSKPPAATEEADRG